MTPSTEGSSHPCLSYLEVLDDEDRAFEGTEDTPPDPLRAEYAAARQGGDPLAERLATDKFRAALFTRIRQRERTALCFSGGGIRSATFGLGILQGLAARSRCADGKRPALLGEFDYLSTVSGGGYLGAWFSAWATRLGRPGAVSMKNYGEPEPVDGTAAVISELSRSPDASFDPEPDPVKYLRAYTNYLSPRLGALSADTWTLVATVLRNMFLNWLVLLPVFAAALLIPVLSWRLVRIKPQDIPNNTLWFLLLSALVLGGIATAYIGYDLPNAGNGRRSCKGFLWGCLVPLTHVAVLLNTFWAWLPPGGGSDEWWDLVGLGKAGLRWWHLGAFGALMHGGGMLFGIGWVSLRYNRPPRKTGLAATAAAAATGFAGGVAALWIASAVPVTPDGAVTSPRIYAALGFPAMMAIFLLSGTLLVGATSYVTEDEDREWWARAGGWIMAITTGWLASAFAVLYAAQSLDWLNSRVSAGFAALTGASGWLVSRMGASTAIPSGAGRSEADTATPPWITTVMEYARKLLLPVFLLLLAMLLAAANQGLIAAIGRLPDTIPSFWPTPLRPLGLATAHALWLMIAYGLVCLIASWFINVNKFSLHGMYRMRLIRAYLGASNAKRRPHRFTGFDENDNIPMCALTRSRPLHVINMALNLVGGARLAWQQRKAESFTSSRLHTGSCRVGYRVSTIYGGRYREGTNKSPITLGTAMTISGAAASPNMGYHSSALLTLVMTLFNARLGWWLGNPKMSDAVWRRPGPRWGVRPFIDESFGLTTDENAWLYLSDGGHFENLGVYEMVLRRCGLIVVSDAGCDPSYVYEDLANAVRKVRVDLGIPIEFVRPSMPMSSNSKPDGERTGHHCAIGHIHYAAVDPGAKLGTIIYIKASLNGNEPPDVQQYAATARAFPHQPTTDQFFDEAQFESYRRLGLHIIEEICAAGDSNASLGLAEFVSVAEQYSAGATLPVLNHV